MSMIDKKEKEDMKSYLKNDLDIVIQRNNENKIGMFTKNELTVEDFKNTFSKLFGDTNFAISKLKVSESLAYCYEITEKQLIQLKDLFGSEDNIFKYEKINTMKYSLTDIKILKEFIQDLENKIRSIDINNQGSSIKITDKKDKEIMSIISDIKYQDNCKDLFYNFIKSNWGESAIEEYLSVARFRQYLNKTIEKIRVYEELINRTRY